jgi:hypothetical protein
VSVLTSLEVRAGNLIFAERRLHHSDCQSGEGHEGLVLATEAIERRRRRLEGAVEVVDDWQDPRDRQLGGALEVRVIDAALESSDPVDGDERAVVVSNLDGGNSGCEKQLGSGPVVQCVGSELYLADPRAALRHATAHLPEQPEDAEDVRQWRDVVRQEPTDGDS